MFRLIIVAGPNSGQVFNLKDGENQIGRIEGNDIVLKSSRVSKHHCSIIVAGARVSIEDKGSSNGTFVNGVLVKQKPLRTRDRVTVGEFVLEVSPNLRGVVSRNQNTGITGGTDFITGGITSPINTGSSGTDAHSHNTGMFTGGVGQSSAGSGSHNNKKKSLLIKYKELFDTHVLTKVYAYNQQQEWRMILMFVFGGFIVLNLMLSVWPVIDANQKAVEAEATKRGKTLVHRMVEQNNSFIYSDNLSRLDVNFATQDDGVVLAAIVDMDGRILAPASLMNQYISSSTGGTQALKSLEQFKGGETRVRIKQVDSSNVGIAEPILVFSREQGKNIPKAMAYVVFSTAQLTLEASEIGATYFETLITSGILGIIILYVLYNLTVQPLRQVAEELDLVLKGQAGEVQKKYKFAEISYLIDLINTVLQRASLGTATGDSAEKDAFAEATINSLRSFYANSKTGYIILNADRKVQSINHAMEEISGIREKSSLNEEVSNIGRDEALPGLLLDLVNRASVGDEPPSDMFDFNGVNFNISCMAMGKPGNVPSVFVIAANKDEV